MFKEKTRQNESYSTLNRTVHKGNSKKGWNDNSRRKFTTLSDSSMWPNVLSPIILITLIQNPTTSHLVLVNHVKNKQHSHITITTKSIIIQPQQVDFFQI